ncbi:MAG: hypothetical protein NVS3B7_19010 [Candidatus Elarobacter sp.]
MPGAAVTTVSVITCPHGGPVHIVSSNARVLAAAPVATLADPFIVSGCAFATPSPCVEVQWTAGTTRVLIGGVPAVIQTGVGMTISATGTAGPPLVLVAQTRVMMT